MSSFLKSFWNGEEGATAVEYGLMVALIAGVIVATVTLLGQAVNTTFSAVTTAIAPAAGS